MLASLEMEGITTDDSILQQLSNYLLEKNFVKYGEVVTKNLSALNNFEADFWRELFFESEYDEISFWIGYPLRELTIHDIVLINTNYEDLYQRGLSRVLTKGINKDELVSIMEYLEELLDTTDPHVKKVIQGRIDQLNNNYH